LEEPEHNQAFRKPDESASQTSQAEALNLSVLAELLWNHTHTHRVVIQAPRLFLHMRIHEQQSFRTFIDQDFASQTECHSIATFDLSLQFPLPLTQSIGGQRSRPKHTERALSKAIAKRMLA
jgi:hypothetical protein